MIWAAVDEVEFSEDVKVCLEGKQITAPHWKLGDKVEDGPGSKKPAAYLIKGVGKSWELKVNVKINKLIKLKGKANLIGTFMGLELKGEFDLAEKAKNSVAVKITNPPSSISHYKGEISWGLELVKAKTSISLNSCRAELFFLLDTPTDVYTKFKGTWVEALRFLCTKVMITGQNDKAEVAKRITEHCLMRHELKYDIINGASHYHIEETPQQCHKFLLTKYIDRKRPFANCYDQASAVKALCGAVGVKAEWLFMSPFGYIVAKNLLGVGLCNNPFARVLDVHNIEHVKPATMQFILMNWKKIATDAPEDKRQAFLNHAFCEFSAKIYDACAGPCLGTLSRTAYAVDTIDTTTKLNAKWNETCRPSDVFSENEADLKSRIGNSIWADVLGVKQVK